MRKLLGKVKNPSKAKEYRRKLSIRQKVSGTSERPRNLVLRKQIKTYSFKLLMMPQEKLCSVCKLLVRTLLAAAPTKRVQKFVGEALAKKLMKATGKECSFLIGTKKIYWCCCSSCESIRENGVQI